MDRSEETSFAKSASGMPFGLAGQHVLVVGAGSGIGAATARLANQLGAHVILAGRSEASLSATQARLAVSERSTLLPSFDYLDAEAVQTAINRVEALDHVLVPAVADENAKRGAFVDLPLTTMHASFDKFWGSVNVVRAAAPRLTQRGSITLFGSISGIKPPPASSGLSVMNAVHAAVIQLGRSLALELSPVRVNVLAPGAVLTNVWTADQRRDLTDWMTKELPVRHAGQPEDLALAAVALVANPYVTGTVQVVDGGKLLT